MGETRGGEGRAVGTDLGPLHAFSHESLCQFTSTNPTVGTALTYRLELARARSLRPVTAPSPEQHAELVARLKGELLAAEQRVEDQEQLVSEAEERLNKANEEEEGIRMAREEEENKGGDVVDPVVWVDRPNEASSLSLVVSTN